MRKQIVGFLIIGGIAFIIDAGILQGLVIVGVDPYVARLFSIFTAIVFTWWFNRKHSFQIDTKPNLKEFLKYFSTSAAGASINWVSYSVLIIYFIIDSNYLVVAAGIATCIAMVFNFLSMKYLVFKK